MKKKLVSATVALTLLAGALPAFADETAPTTNTNTSVSATSDASTTTIAPTTTAPTTAVDSTTNQTTTTTTGTTGTSGTTTTSTDSTTNVSVDPSSFSYKLQDLLNELRLLFTFKDQAKADLLVEQANTKIAELQTLNKDGNEDYNEQYIEKINAVLEKAQKLLKEAKVEAETEKDDKAKVEIEKKESETVKTEKHSLVVLKALLASKKAAGKNTHGIENAIAKQEAKLKAQLGTTTEATAPAPTEAAPAPTQPATSTTTAPSTDATQASTSTDANVQVNVPAVGNVQVKSNNGLHLGQIKNHEKKSEKEDQEHERDHERDHDQDRDRD